jgi:hypothetical protein
MRIAIALIAALVSAQPALAGLERWTAEVTDDPFSKGTRVVVDYMSSLRSGVLIFCDTKQSGVKIRALPGYVFQGLMADLTPKMEIAVDGEMVISGDAEVGSVGDNLTAVEVDFDKGLSQLFVDKFAVAQRQVALKDGMSDAPYLLSARGSTKAAGLLKKCVDDQG